MFRHHCIPALTAILGASMIARATDFTWNAAAGGLFHAPINWTPFQFQPPIVGPPGAGEMATYALGAGNGNYTVTFGTDPTNSRCRIGDDHVLFDLAGHSYTLTSTTSTSITLAGIGFLDDARLTLSNGTLIGHDADIGASNFSSAAQLIVGSGATLNLGGFLSVGTRDNGTLTVQSGGDVSCVGAYVGEINDISGANGNGVINVTGAGSTLTVGGNANLNVGQQGPGTLNVTAGGAVTGTGYLYTGLNPNVNATIAIDGAGSSCTFDDSANIGYIGSATMTISNGGHFNVTDQATIGTLTGSVGNVTVTGPGSSFTSVGLFVGVSGEAHFTLSGGATGDSFGGITGDTWIAGGDTGVGTMLVTGEGTTWTAGHTLSVGRGGTGFMTISAGADVTTEAVRIGAFGLYTPEGTLTVDGPGSTLNSTSDFTIGGTNTGAPQGDGTLIISNGGSVTHQALGLPHILVYAGSDIILNGGSLTAPAIISHGGLSGSGTVSANLTSDGIVATGNSPGTLNIVGNVTLQAAGALNIEIGGTTPGTQYDRLAVTGNVTLGGTLNVSLLNGFVPVNQQFVIVTSTGGSITGQFAAISPAGNWQVLYHRNSVVLRRMPTCPADIAPAAGDGSVNVNDLLAVINGWGTCPVPCPPACAADIAPSASGGDCAVNVNDLLAVINAWGLCPCSPTGTWVNSAPISYYCAFGSVNVNIPQWTFSQPGSMLSVSGGGLPGALTGPAANCGAGQSFTVNFIYSGNCTETYTLTGTFASPNQFTGTFTIGFSGGNCFDCTNRTFPVSASRP